MERHLEIKSKIHDLYEDLTKSQKIIAEYVVDNFDSIPFKSVHQVKEATSASVASVVRFAQKVGFKGFLELRDEIAKALETRIKKNEIFSLIDDSKKKNKDLLSSIAKQEIDNINETVNLIERQNFKSAIELIISSKKVYTLGLGISYLLSEILAYQLNQVAVNAINLTHNQLSFMEQILFANREELLVAFSFPPYSKETINSVKFAKERGLKVISITNKTSAPISRFSDVQLNVSSKNMLFTNSFSAASVIINAIATQCALNNKSKAETMLSELNKIVKEQKLVLT
jgi:DNA-binding MurR/RpiR family transcriptional regulator